MHRTDRNILSNGSDGYGVYGQRTNEALASGVGQSLHNKMFPRDIIAFDDAGDRRTFCSVKGDAHALHVRVHVPTEDKACLGHGMFNVRSG